ncbi:hypothetical protein EDF60_0630 [Leucobacter luti]|uniref:hypothetical protein n=1 Tax=Leucobacter luti TaxID=340320 RepID=UPI00104F6765|nr:hypothetical protein [Leucobacter luti]MCW2288440.1 hypothetical protein [Leucobacter luti]TCK45403.1 hypothetical protein EDF60_0630 [Leucobacter luti]
MNNSHTTLIRSSSVLAAALLVGASLTGCSAIDAFKNSAADAWQVTYEVSVDSTEPTTLTAVSYLDQATRADTRAPVVNDSVTASPREGGIATWSVESIVIVGDTTSVTATPAEGLTATCRILLDGTREIASETSAAGAPVQCEAVAPPFDQ